jgi:predicted nucleotidyltransferase
MIHMYRKSYLDLLTPFFEHPESRFHIREYAKVLHIGPMTARRYLKALLDEKLIVPKAEKIRVKSFQANIENPLFREHKKFYTIIKLWRSGLIDYLNELFLYPPIYLFGSAAKGEDIKGSDIDLFIFSENQSEPELERFEQLFKREIQLFVMTSKQFERAKKVNPELINNILNGIRLSGFLRVFK